MIYKIQGNFNNNLEKLLKDISKNYDIFFCGNVLYVGLKSLNNSDNIKSILKTSKNYYIEKIDETNLKYEAPQVIEWIRDKFIKLDTERFENENQEVLKRTMKFIDEVEQNLEKIIQEGGENNGRGTDKA